MKLDNKDLKKVIETQIKKFEINEYSNDTDEFNYYQGYLTALRSIKDLLITTPEEWISVNGKEVTGWKGVVLTILCIPLILIVLVVVAPVILVISLIVLIFSIPVMLLGGLK